jgi:HSP20 family protein
MLMRSDPFRELDRLTEQLWSKNRTPWMPLDAFRQGDQFLVRFDLPGVDPSSIDLTVEKNALTVSATRNWPRQEGVEVLASERPQGTFRRQLFLGDNLDLDHIQADYEHGVLTITVPVAEQAKPRRVEVTAGGRQDQIEANTVAA